MSKWIPVSETPIPLDGIPVLVYLEKEMQRSRVHAAFYLPNVKIIGTLFYFDAPKPTHWMPMIEGPEGLTNPTKPA
jgi:hypothetical protein